jgi:uncharacterized membrane protein
MGVSSGISVILLYFIFMVMFIILSQVKGNGNLGRRTCYRVTTHRKGDVADEYFTSGMVTGKENRSLRKELYPSAPLHFTGTECGTAQ